MFQQPAIFYKVTLRGVQYYSEFIFQDLSSLRQLTLEKIQLNTRRLSALTLTFDNILRGIRLHYILAVILILRNKKVC